MIGVNILDSNMKKALEIFAILIKGESINTVLNNDLYNEYRLNSSIQMDLEEIVNVFDLNLYSYDEAGLFVSAGVDNKVFGFSNDELKNILKLKRNEQLYLCYFIIYSTVMFFYIQSGYRTNVKYIKPSQVVDKVEEKLMAIQNRDDEGSSDKSFKILYKIWRVLPLSNTANKDKINEEENSFESKIGFVNKTLKFMVSNNLLFRNKDMGVYMPTPKLDAAIDSYFNERDVKNSLMELLSDNMENVDSFLEGGMQDAEY